MTYYKKICVVARDKKALEKIKEMNLAKKINSEELSYFIVNELEKVPKCDLLIVAGGDGSLFYAVDKMEEEAPILHLNLGRKGALAETNFSQLMEKITNLKKGKFILEEVKKMEVFINETKIGEAINDVVFASKSLKGIMEIETEIEGLGTFRIDATGIIVASPLGSTAFSMSAGGPVVDNELSAFIITPILAKRKWAPLVVSNRRVIKITKKGGKEVPVVIRDGLEEVYLKEEDVLKVRESKRKVRLVRFDEQYLLRRIKRALVE